MSKRALMHKENKQPVSTSEYDGNSSSIVASAGQVMAVIVALGLISMISSLLVAEYLGGDAGNINRAGELRMQAMRISRAFIIDDTNDSNTRIKEINSFEEKLSYLVLNSNSDSDPQIASQLHTLEFYWNKIKTSQNSISPEYFDNFVTVINTLVNLLQRKSEEKLALLRLIQGISVFLLLMFTCYVLVKLNRLVVSPLKELVNVAFQAGKGNFDLKASYTGENELGLLSSTINQMSHQLKSTYQEFEERVDEKTLALRETNQTLEVLYRATRNLSNQEYIKIEKQIIQELEHTLGTGRISIVLNQSNTSDLFIYKSNTISTDHMCMNISQFVLKKRGRYFGDIFWQVPKGETVHEWQKQLLQAMSDIIATAIELEQKKNTENRLLIAEERAVIARELHDSLAQSLSYLKVQMSLLTRKVDKALPQDQINITIDDIKSGLNNAYLQLRELLTTFRLKLDDPSIENALQGTVAEFSEKCQHPITLEFRLEQNTLTANQEVHVLQIVREALSNVHRHANASVCKVSLIKENEKVKVDIWDNGDGFSPETSQSGHFGLGIMEERAHSLNALIDLQRVKPHGTNVSLEFQL